MAVRIKESLMSIPFACFLAGFRSFLQECHRMPGAWQASLGAVLLLLIVPLNGRSEIHCEKPAVNAGVVFTGTRLLQRFVLVNRGKSEVQILEAKASCGCLSPRLDRMRLLPAETGILELEINTLSQPSGPNTWAVRLRYREGESVQETSLRLSASLVSEVQVEPAALVLLADKAAGHEVSVRDTRGRSLKLLDARAGSGKLKTRITAVGPDKQGHAAFKIALDVPDEYPEGRHQDVLHIYTDDPKYADLCVPVTIIKSSQKHLSALPGEVNLTVPAGQPAPARIVLIRDPEGQPVKIANLSAGDPAIICRWAEGPNSMATVKIQVNRALVHGHTLSDAVQVEVMSPIRETLTIPVNYNFPER
ncbi:MAG TPA: DUF1573 domain-containing protein [Gemmataceae bacterium]|nr:DUF1573 domain-containing protein [Gemmataceae bacterium]